MVLILTSFQNALPLLLMFYIVFSDLQQYDVGEIPLLVLEAKTSTAEIPIK
jgi:hypothetical protein